ncbi:MAG TPA: hypothetical protein VKB38_01145 [Terracidiphilus sp.]|nr:hypothetical protein [Terracidiphilus sp.]
MTVGCRRAATVVLMIPALLLSGCLFTTRKLPVPKAPTIVQSASAEELVNRLDKNWDALQSLYANVEIQLSVTKSSEGTAKDYTSIPGIILLRKPEMLRVVGFAPVVRTRIFDMVSNGNDFTLYLPTQDKAYKGPNKLTHKSPNAIENLRPGFFLDALVVRGVQPGDDHMVTADQDTVEDVKKKHLLIIPEYILTIMRRKANSSSEYQAVRVITFHREDLMPYQQDLYDDQGNLETVVTYGNYLNFEGGKFPSTVTIKSKKPEAEFQVVLTVEKVKQQALKDDQFQLQLSEDTQIKTLE